jgi:hypothetical protein
MIPSYSVPPSAVASAPSIDAQQTPLSRSSFLPSLSSTAHTSIGVSTHTPGLSQRNPGALSKLSVSKVVSVGTEWITLDGRSEAAHLVVKNTSFRVMLRLEGPQSLRPHSPLSSYKVTGELVYASQPRMVCVVLSIDRCCQWKRERARERESVCERVRE